MNRRRFLKLIGTAAVGAIFAEDRVKKAIASEVLEKISPVIETLESLEPQAPVVEAPDLTPKPQERPEISNPEKISTQITATPQEFGSEPISAEVKEIDPSQLNLELFPTFDEPFKYQEVNKELRELKLNLGDLLNPDQEKIKYFNAINDSTEILPIFTPEVMKWSELVQRKCFEYNIEHPNNLINPNFVLSIISLESQGIEGAKSPAGALGLMQLTSFVYAEGYFGKYTADSILIPDNNIEVGIAYLADIVRRTKKLGLTGLEIFQYAVMEYNGGTKNASRFFKTKQALDVNGANSPIFEIDSDQKIKDFLRGFYGNSNNYHTYGTNLVKKESLYYKENFTRFAVMAEISKKLLENGYSQEQIKMMLSESTMFKSLISLAFVSRREIRNSKGVVSYFDFKSIIDHISMPGFDLDSIASNDKQTSKNPANLMMDLIYS